MDDLPIVPRHGDAYIVSANETPIDGNKQQLPKDWWKWALGFVGGGVMLSGIVSTVMFIKQTTDQVTRAVDRQSRLIKTLSDDSIDSVETTNNSNSYNPIAQVQAGYENPFDENTNYQNPFSAHVNPFDEIEEQ